MFKNRLLTAVYYIVCCKLRDRINLKELLNFYTLGNSSFELVRSKLFGFFSTLAHKHTHT